MRNNNKNTSIFKMLRQNIRLMFTPRRLSPKHVTGPVISSEAESRLRSLFLRHLDCGSCNGCEMELNALSNPIYDIAQYGIRFESSPRHADLLVMTGPYTRNLDEAAQLTAAAMPKTRIITIGDCTQNGGVFQDSYAVIPKPEQIENAIEAHVSGCPPNPNEILNLLLTIDPNPL